MNKINGNDFLATIELELVLHANLSGSNTLMIWFL